MTLEGLYPLRHAKCAVGLLFLKSTS